MLSLSIMQAANKIFDETNKPDATPHKMVIEPRHRVGAFTYSEGCRYALGGIQINAQHKFVAATDSRMVIIVPIETDIEQSVIVQPKTIDLAAEGLKPGQNRECLVAATDAYVTVSRSDMAVTHDQVIGRFPDVLAVMPTKEPKATVCLDGRLLLEFLRHCCDRCVSKGVRVHIKLEVHEPNECVVMECREDNITNEMLCKLLLMPLHED